MAKNVDCNNVNDNLSQRICANLAFQRSDSLLTIVYDSLLQIATERNAKTMKEKIVALQKTWRKLRDQHCTIIYDQYKNCGGCHQQAIAYLNCLREMTDSRIIELEKMKEELN